MKSIGTILYILCIFILAACGKSSVDEPPMPSPTPDPTPDPGTEQPVETVKSNRTVLVYMIGANNLSAYAKEDILEMQEALANSEMDGGNLLVYRVSYGATPILYRVSSDNMEELKTYDNDEESLSIARMRQVVEDMKSLYPDQEYGIVFWGHATGWFENGYDDPDYDGDGTKAEKPLLYSYGCDESGGKKVWMNTTALGQALRGHGLKFVYFDCCFMGGIEVLYELRGVAPYVSASPTEIKAKGLPYQKAVNQFLDGKAAPESVAREYFTYYNDIYLSGHDDGCPYAIATYDMQYIDALAEATRKIYAEATALQPDGYKVQQFGVSMNGYQNYFYDFDDYVSSLLGANHPLVLEWRNIMDKVVVYKETSKAIWGTPINKYCGLSTYMIKSKTDANLTNSRGYSSLGWYQDVASVLVE